MSEDKVTEPGRAATPTEASETIQFPIPEPKDAEAAPEAGESCGDAGPEDTAPPQPVGTQQEQVVRIAQKARVQWFNEDGTVEQLEQCNRSLAAIFVFLGTAAETKTHPLTQKVSVELVIVDDDGQPATMTDSKGAEKSVVGIINADSTLDQALDHLAMRAMPPHVAYAKLQGAIAQISEQSDLKCAVVTLIFGDAKPTGMVFMSDATEVTDQDLIMLGTSTESFMDQYKNAMREQRNIEFPGDNPIILPGLGAVPPRDFRG